MAEHAWDLRMSADNMRWKFRATCNCGWEGSWFRQEMRGKHLEPRVVSMQLAAGDGIAHVRSAREPVA